MSSNSNNCGIFVDQSLQKALMCVWSLTGGRNQDESETIHVYNLQTDRFNLMIRYILKIKE